MKLRKLVHASAIAWCAAAAAPSIASSPGDEARARVDKVAATLAAEMAQLCPAADPGDQAAFDACRKALYQDSRFKRSLNAYEFGRSAAETDAKQRGRFAITLSDDELLGRE